jgi:squalene synthase HpnC
VNVTANASELRSGKGHRDENFPVASMLIPPECRAPILAFYEFVRTADDVADHATLSPEEKVALLDALERDLLGQSDGSPQAVALRSILDARKLSPVHAQDLLKAFRLDATKKRYKDWDDLIAYCAWSAMPVGRFVLDVHGESRETWRASDAICAALQINNHLQDCGNDYRNLDRVYIPQDAMAEAGTSVEALGQAKSSPQMLQCIRRVAARTRSLLDDGEVLTVQVKSFRLGMEISAIHTMALKINDLLLARDPLSENVHLSKAGKAGQALLGALKACVRRVSRPSTAPASASRQ